MSNPFFYGNPVPPDQFLDRRRALRRITSRIVNRGQSTAIVGEPHSGKTSLLMYLSAPEIQMELYGEKVERLLFSYMDIQTLSGEFSQAQFWEHGLRPLHKRVIVPNPDSSLSQAYQMCQENDFGAFALERLFAQMRPTGWRLVLMLDEFDLLLHHPTLNCGEFFGSLRSLASRSRGALALVIASRRPLASLNEATQQFNRTGSPYFNFLTEVILGALPNEYVTELLHRAGDRFTAEDHCFIGRLAGGHPHLVQVAASALWEAYEEGEGDAYWRRQQAEQSLYDEAAQILDDAWRLWPSETRKALTAVALVHINTLEEREKLLEKHQFNVERLIHEIGDFDPELRSLEKHGLVVRDEAISGGWRVCPHVLLRWLANELVRMARGETTFGGEDLLKPENKLQSALRGLWHDREARQIWLDGKEITRELSADQYALLVFMCQHPGVICTKDEVAQAVWPNQSEEGITDGQIYQLIKRVREKIELDPLNPCYIVTIRGQGYRLERP
ncbi:MAG: winged helix-turn-helix domain-containing protein [Chloroflexota bacterium]|nr:winged helix-turn-helix domain-containing protein [Chloroflexota bacterium]